MRLLDSTCNMCKKRHSYKINMHCNILKTLIICFILIILYLVGLITIIYDFITTAVTADAEYDAVSGQFADFLEYYDHH